MEKINSNIIVQSMVDSAPFGMLAISLVGELIYINKKAKALINFSKYASKNINLFTELPELNNRVEKFKNSKCFLEENILIDKGNTTLNCDVSSLVVNESIEGYVLILKDMKSVIDTVNKYSNNQASCTFEDIIGESPQIKKVINESIQISDSPSSVLIGGESGSGKELLAQSIHNESSRKNNPFIAVNCGALPKNLIESELFGYEEGTFTGAKKGGSAGKFELANGGTIFLDEIGEMPIEMQVTLLRVLQEGYVTRIGGKRNIPVDVRVIAATHKDLKEEIKKGNFRSDLFYRLNVIPITMPPLKDRIGDVPVLLEYFLDKKSEKLSKPIPKISQSLYKKMISYCWPGNVRELENFVENIVNLNGSTTCEINLAECHCLTHDNLGNPISRDVENQAGSCLHCQSEEGSITPLLTLEQREIKKAVQICDGNMTKVANSLGISRNALYNKIKRYNL